MIDNLMTEVNPKYGFWEKRIFLLLLYQCCRLHDAQYVHGMIEHQI